MKLIHVQVICGILSMILIARSSSQSTAIAEVPTTSNAMTTGTTADNTTATAASNDMANTTHQQLVTNATTPANLPTNETELATKTVAPTTNETAANSTSPVGNNTTDGNTTNADAATATATAPTTATTTTTPTPTTTTTSSSSSKSTTSQSPMDENTMSSLSSVKSAVTHEGVGVGGGLSTGGQAAIGLVVIAFVVLTAAFFIYIVRRRYFRPFGRYSTLNEFGTYEELSTPSYGYNQTGDQDL